MAPSLPSNGAGGQRCGRTTLCAKLVLARAFAPVSGCVPNGPAVSTDGGSVTAARQPRERRPRCPTPPAALPFARHGAPAIATRTLGSARRRLRGQLRARRARVRTGTSPAAIGTSTAGRLCVKGAHNHGVWLNRTLPINVRIEFDARQRLARRRHQGRDLRRRRERRDRAARTTTPRATSPSSAAGRTTSTCSRGSTSTPPIAPRSGLPRLGRRASAPGERRAGLPLQNRARRRKTAQLVGRRHAHVQICRPTAALRPGARPLRFQRMGSAGVLRQREGHAAAKSIR